MKEKDPINVIIPAAGMGRRMKSYGPKPLIKIGNSTIIKNQISLVRSHMPNANIILVCGFQAAVLMNSTPNNIIKVENERYNETNVVRSIGMGLRAINGCSKVVIIYGDLVFNTETIQSITFKHSSIIIANEKMGQEEVGCVIDKNRLQHLMYDLPNKWGQIAIFVDKELELLQELCWDRKNSSKFGFEIINEIIEQGGKFRCIENKNIKIVDIDNSKDIHIAQEILL
jgi:choline kinase